MVLLLVTACTAGAAGLGRLVVLSAMGEPFRAEIDLLSYQDEWAALQPRVASPDRYQLADFRYSPALSGAQLQVRHHPNGRNYIEVSTTRPVNEPYVYLLIELDWNGARVTRAYTALLDPYGYGAPRDSIRAEFLPVTPSIAAPRSSLAPRTPRQAPAYVATNPVAGLNAAPALPLAPPPQTAAGGASVQHLEAQVDANNKSLAAMLARVEVMEEQVRQLQRELAMQNAVGAGVTPPAVPPKLTQAAVAKAPPVVQAVPVAELPPRRARSLSDTLLNEALLVLAGSALLLLGGLAYWMSKRPRLQE